MIGNELCAITVHCACLLYRVQAVLYYYQSGGRLRRPIEVPEEVFLEELEFYQISDETIRQYKEKEGFLMEKKKALPGKLWQRTVWLFCEEPESSKAAKVRHISCELQTAKIENIPACSVSD